MKAIGYARCSTDKQENSIDAQERRIRALAVARGFELTEVIADFDEFSGNLNRPGAKRLIELVKNKSIQAVIITKLDRMTRDVRDALNLADLFRKHGVAFISIDDSIDTNSPMGEFFYVVMAALGQLERKLIGTRTRDGLRNLKAQGMPAGKAPYGWTAQPRTTEEKTNKIRKPLLIDKDEQKILAFATDLRKSGSSYESIADELNVKGYRTRAGGKWVYQYVIGILKSGGIQVKL